MLFDPFQNEPPTAIGIDIGKETLHICIAQASNPIAWHVHALDLTSKSWYDHILIHIPPHSVVCCEPTGWHYFLPLANHIMARNPLTQIVHVNHQQTTAMRRMYLSKAKTDNIDARALALIAQQIVNSNPIAGVHPYNHNRAVTAHGLRLLINQYIRNTKTNTRTLNQIDAMAHSIAPIFAQYKDAYINAIAHGAVTPQQIAQLLDKKEIAHQTRSSWKRLLIHLPHIDVNPIIEQAIRNIYEQYAFANGLRDQAISQMHTIIHTEPFTSITSRWNTVPTIDTLTIASLLVATNGTPHAYTVSQFKSAVGVAPITHSSGKKDSTKREPRGGYRPAGVSIHFLAMRLIQQKTPELYKYSQSHTFSATKRKLAGVLWGIAHSPEGKFPSD
jgi:transposase